MCGIAGIIGLGNRDRNGVVIEMSKRLSHRGPDDFGIYLDECGEAALAHRRLSIVDLSTNGHQPMTTPDGRWTITFNGEIYNHAELRRELECHGIKFSSSSDTEVLLQGFRVWGEKVLDRVIGMFAFGIWDSKEKELFLARDRVGKKPLVYFVHNRTIAFASELKALLAVPNCQPVLDPSAVDGYLALGYIPAPLSIFCNVQKLPAGHLLRWRDGQFQVVRYWKPEEPVAKSRVDGDGVGSFRQLFQQAVHLRLAADVPVGIYLSGGLDSSAIAVECAKSGQNIEALTVAFDADVTDLPHARAVAQRLGLRHQIVETTGPQLAEDLGRIHWFYDEPFADSSNIPCYYLARQTQGRFKVILTGDGGDESLAGYRHYEFIGLKQLAKRGAAALGWKDGSWKNPLATYFQSKALFRRFLRRQLLEACPAPADGFTNYLGSDPFLQAIPKVGALHRALWADRHVYLPNDLLYKMDIALMSHGIEGRSPFLDHRLLEWCQGLLPTQLIRRRSKKRLLRHAYQAELPAEILGRPKHGFGAPMKRWLQGPLRSAVHDYLPTKLLSVPPQQKVLREFERTGNSASVRQLWTLLTFAIWANQWNATW